MQKTHQHNFKTCIFCRFFLVLHNFRPWHLLQLLSVTMNLVIDVLLVEVIEVIIIFVERKPTIPNILPLKPLLFHGFGMQFALNTNRIQHQRQPEEMEIFTKYIRRP